MVAYNSSYLSATVCFSCGFSFQDLNHICKIKMVCVVSVSRLEEELLRMISYECCLVKQTMLFLHLSVFSIIRPSNVFSIIRPSNVRMFHLSVECRTISISAVGRPDLNKGHG